MGENGEVAVTDFRDSKLGRRQSWFGLKRHVKRVAAYPAPHMALRMLARLFPRLRSGRLPAPRHLREVQGEVDGAVYVMLRPDRCEIAKELYWGRGRRPRREDSIALEIVVRLATEADTLIDIGAYTGVFTLAATAANPELDVHAFDIVPAVCDLLDANVHRNHVHDRVVIHREGVGIPGSTMTVPVGEGGSALPSFYSSRMTFDSGVETHFRSLDSLADLLVQGRRVVMKIDVEGTESAIFEHGRRFLATFGPDILCEVLQGASDPEALSRVLAPLQYRPLLVTKDGLSPRPTISPHPHYRDWLFTLRNDSSLRSLGLRFSSEPTR
jgi:FkbM family methyltransferase